ncbi:MAG: hypothetical protein ACN6OP_25755 [Pseudomonadales bacterium]
MADQIESSEMDVSKTISELLESLPIDVDTLITKFDGKNQKSVKVMRSKDARQSLKGVYAFEASGDSPFVRTIRIYGPLVPEIEKNIRISLVFPTGAVTSPKSLTKNGTYAYLAVHRAISGFEIHPKNSRKSIEVTKLEVTGHPFSEVENAERKLSEIIKIRNEISSYKKEKLTEFESLKLERDALQERVNSLTLESETTKGDVDEATSELEGLRSSISSESATRDKLIAENRVAQNTVTQLGEKAESLNKSVSNGEIELRKLTDKRRLISDEFSSFVDEGRGQARVYGWISLIPAIMAAVALAFLIYGGWNFAKLAVTTPTQAYAYFIQRLPYTAATLTIVGILLEILRQIVKKIMTIHEDRLALARLLVIARDATYASATDLDMDEDEIFTQRMKVKMQLLKAHLGLENPQQDAISNSGNDVSD